MMATPRCRADARRLLSATFILASLLALSACTSSSQNEDNTTSHAHHRSIFAFNLRSDGQQCRAEWRKAPPLAPDVWDRVERRFSLPNSTTNPRIITERNWYTRNQGYLNRVSGRASRYIYYVANQLEARQLPGELALLPIVESAYNPFALSRSQASGLWQFIPGTAKHLKMDMNWWYDARRDIPASTETALEYLIFLRDHYDGDWLKAIAAYNAGWGTIDRAVEKNRARGLPTDYWSLDVPDETMAYVPKLLALAQIVRNPEAYGVHWAYIPDLPYFAQVTLDSPMDITLAADMASVSSDELYLLNPGISRWATPPGGQYRLLLPIDQANEFAERIAGLGEDQKMNLVSSQATANPMVQEMERKAASHAPAIPAGHRSYSVKRGDTWWSVAKANGTTPETLRQLNKLPADEPLKLGQKIAIPGGKQTAAVAATDMKQTAGTKTGRTSKAKTHTVKSGDTLMGIARQHQLDINDLARWNALDKNRHTLKPGQQLTFYQPN